MQFENKRQFNRAPLRTFTLYSDEGFVFKARLQNISEGGILVESLPHLPGVTEVPFFIDLPIIPKLNQLNDDEIFAINNSDLKRCFIRVVAKTVRRVGETTSVDDMFIQIGCQFSRIDESERALIAEYVEVFKDNLNFLIGILKDKGDQIDEKRIKKVSQILGYGEIKSTMLLNQKLITDRSSLFET